MSRTAEIPSELIHCGISALVNDTLTPQKSADNRMQTLPNRKFDFDDGCPSGVAPVFVDSVFFIIRFLEKTHGRSSQFIC